VAYPLGGLGQGDHQPADRDRVDGPRARWWRTGAERGDVADVELDEFLAQVPRQRVQTLGIGS
jgi:hypothetical protein